MTKAIKSPVIEAMSSYEYVQGCIDDLKRRHKKTFDTLEELQTHLEVAKDELKIAMIAEAESKGDSIYEEGELFKFKLQVRRKRKIDPHRLLRFKNLTPYLGEIFKPNLKELDLLLESGLLPKRTVDAITTLAEESYSPEFALTIEFKEDT